MAFRGVYRNAPQKTAFIDQSRLKRFRMLDPEEFEEMLTSSNDQLSNVHENSNNNLDQINGMQVASNER